MDRSWRLGYTDPRLDAAYEWMARTVTGEGLAPNSDRDAPLRYYAGKCGPLFACGSNDKLPCAWGAAKVMLAFSLLPVERRTPLIRRAIQQGVDFLFSVDPATAGYPSGYSAKPSGNWWKFGFPVFYVTDLLQIVEALVGLGYGERPAPGERPPAHPRQTGRARALDDGVRLYGQDLGRFRPQETTEQMGYAPRPQSIESCRMSFVFYPER